MKVRLLRQLSAAAKVKAPSGLQGPPQAHQFISLLLEEYGALCQAARSISTFLGTLVREKTCVFLSVWMNRREEKHVAGGSFSCLYADLAVAPPHTVIGPSPLWERTCFLSCLSFLWTLPLDKSIGWIDNQVSPHGSTVWRTLRPRE